MKKGKILIAVGALMLVAGIYFTAYAVLPVDETIELTIPGGDYYYYISYSGLIGGSIEMDYTVADGAVNIYIFDSDEFAEYGATGIADDLYTTSGDSGSFTFDVPDTGTYYVVLEHGSLSGILSQDVMLDTTINGIAITGIVIGVILIVAGVAIAFLGSRMKTRESAATPPPPQTGVTFFQGQQQNPPGQV